MATNGQSPVSKIFHAAFDIPIATQFLTISGSHFAANLCAPLGEWNKITPEFADKMARKEALKSGLSIVS
jgi:hypothetical protein